MKKHFHTIKNCLLYIGITLFPAIVTAQGIYISSGARMIMNGEPQLILNNTGFTNNGTFTAGNSTTSFAGAGTGFIDGSTNTQFYKMVVNKKGSSVQARQHLTVYNVYMNSGNMILDGHNLGVSGNIIGESESSYITSNNGGYISVARLLNSSPVAYNPGNIGIEITSSVNPRLIVAYRKHTPITLPNGTQSIKRVFNVITSGAGYNATIRIHYLDPELTGSINKRMISMYKDSSGTWLELGRDSIDINNNIVTKTGIDRFGSFTLGSSTTDQPILVTSPVARLAAMAENIRENFNPPMQAYPGPAHDYFTVTVSGNTSQHSEFLLFDETGRLLQRKKVMLLHGSNNITWDISGYPAGVYYLSTSNGTMQKIKILKQ
jgi:hypothetical protein